MEEDEALLDPSSDLYRYVGLEFHAEDGIHYGYVRVTRNKRSLWFRELAWETEPGVPIQVPIPEPSALHTVIVALGVGLFLIRKRER